jgi:hypothetical protein
MHLPSNSIQSTINLSRQHYAFDVVGEFTFQKKLGFLEKGGDVDGMMAAIEGLLLYASAIGQIPETHPFLLGNPFLPYLIPVSFSPPITSTRN